MKRVVDGVYQVKMSTRAFVIDGDEGLTLIDGPTAAGEFLESTTTVVVRDGRLRLDVGGTATAATYASVYRMTLAELVETAGGKDQPVAAALTTFADAIPDAATGTSGVVLLEEAMDLLLRTVARHDERLDLDRDERLRVELPEDYAVIYSVPPPHDQPGDPRLARFLALLPHPPARFVYLSTTGVYGNRDGDRVDESSEPADQTSVP